MIRVRFEENRLTVCGHAGYAARGEDIVCAAVSALVYALIGDLQERGLVRELVIRPGYVMLCAGGRVRGRVRAGALRAGAAAGALWGVCIRGNHGAWVVTYHGKEMR